MLYFRCLFIPIFLSTVTQRHLQTVRLDGLQGLNRSSYNRFIYNFLQNTSINIVFLIIFAKLLPPLPPTVKQKIHYWQSDAYKSKKSFCTPPPVVWYNNWSIWDKIERPIETDSLYLIIQNTNFVNGLQKGIKLSLSFIPKTANLKERNTVQSFDLKYM